ncbi:sensor histidine kinase [Hydrogenophaga laconesensis]|uniref:Signal transduction histidine kinase n=1 Tax=Hydrogenophaga laconesensis TaxID=1805971 RepID=A0ABU1VBE5_9BURK|nr:histidine kinase [Hydrogenophaga laconesensis]MDR7094640.1 signal transduction histidine kinase [Hydrogenophaga laconesensis]
MPRIEYHIIARRALGAVVINTVIALVITAVNAGTSESLAINLLYSQCIGLSIWVLIDGGRHVLHPSGWPGVWRMAVLVTVAVLLGYAGGSVIANLLLGRPLLASLSNVPRATLGFVLMSLAAGGFGAYYFTSRAMLAHARLAQEEAQRQASEARLRLLESQLEPHMLFNTLANLRVLIGTDPERATAMLDRLNDFLRATLAASRTEANAGQHTLAGEFARLRDYLELMAVRMGPRLHYTLDLPDDLAAQPVPPLLLQPLVENSIRHGLEPSLDGGAIHIRARRHASQLVLEVSDTGVGCEPSPTPGFGLAQVRERLETAYAGRAHMDWHAEPGGGTRALLTLPLQTSSP